MPRRIAIVEDEAAIRANYAEALTRQGYEVAAYAGRPEALAAFRTRLPDLAVIDIGLGDEPEGGFELCRALRAMSPRLPIIFLTARDADFEHRFRPAPGCRRLPHQDISLPHLLARIAALFRRVEVLGRALGRGGGARARRAAPRHQTPQRNLERRAGGADFDGVLDGAHAGEVSRPREGPRPAYARRQTRGGRGAPSPRTSSVSAASSRPWTHRSIPSTRCTAWGIGGRHEARLVIPAKAGIHAA
ncbi:MAG: response regulator [Rhodocyclaceae bacterium]|nr:response regulator [Rhodocyclaceae bacterium]